MNKLVTSFQKTQLGENFLQDVKSSNSYYFITSKSDNTSIDSNFKELIYNTYDNMIQGKKISSNNVALVIRNILYESNKVYDAYDDTVDLSEKDFYVVVDGEFYSHVFKCLDNNLNSPSTFPPSFDDVVNSNSYSYFTSDGYQWKYMYSVDTATVNKFASVDYFPLIANTEVQDSAINGSIDAILIENQGKGYDNYIEGTFKNSEVNVNGNSSLYAVTNSIASSVNGFYTGCLLYISSGAGAGTNRLITDYITNSNGNFIVLDQSININIVGSNYEIYPSVQFFNPGTQTVNAVARALVNSESGNSISRVEILEPGRDYTYHTAEVIANNAVGVSQKAVVRSIFSPKGGHGSDPSAELLCKAVGISVTLSNSEANTIITNNDFNQIGILKDPKFSNVVLSFTSSLASVFTPNESIINYTTINIGTANVNQNTATVTLSQPQSNIINKKLLIVSGNNYQIVNCISATNSSQITASSNLIFSNTVSKISIIEEKSRCTYSAQINSTAIKVNSLSGEWNANDVIVGLSSFTPATINTISRNDKIKNFNTFIQSYKYEVISITGTFEKNEILEQGSSTSVLRSINLGTNNIFYTTNQKGIYNTNNTITGKTSNAKCFISSSKNPELEYASGELLYLEVIDTITRATDQDETFVFYLEF